MCVSVQQKLLLNCCLSLYLDRKREPLITKLENIIAHHRPYPMLARIILCFRLACNNAKIKQQPDDKIQLSTIIKNMSFLNRLTMLPNVLKQLNIRLQYLMTTTRFSKCLMLLVCYDDNANYKWYCACEPNQNLTPMDLLGCLIQSQ